jgi:ribosomal protein L21E
MGKSEILGKVAFINHEKKYAMIEYEVNGKKKTVRGSIDIKLQKDLKEKKLIKKAHHFMIGDMVSFNLKLADKSDKMLAVNIEYLYNNALDMIINKATTDNNLKGYLKVADDKFFVKEMESYVFFPVHISPWQVLPSVDELNEPVQFSLDHPEKKDKAIAILNKVKYIPEYNTAIKLFKDKTIIDAEVYKVTAHGIYLNIVKDKVQAKLAPDQKALQEFKPGDIIPVRINFLSHKKIAVEKV